MKIFICEDDPKQRENMVTIIKNYIMIEEKPMEIALATDKLIILMRCLSKLKI